MLLALLLLAVAPSADDVSRARVHFQAGKTHYELGQYDEAIREFAAGYALSPKPEFLINLGQAYRGAGQPKKALEMFDAYLEKAPASARQRAQVEQLAVELRAELAKAPEVRPADAPVATPAPVLAPEAVAAPPEAVASRAPAPLNPLVWAIPLGVVVAGGIAAAVIVGVTNPVQCAGAGGLGCVDLRAR